MLSLLASAAIVSSTTGLPEPTRDAGQENRRRCCVWAISGCFGTALAIGTEHTGDDGGVLLVDLKTFHRRKLERVLNLEPVA